MLNQIKEMLQDAQVNTESKSDEIVELNLEDLIQISGGKWWNGVTCSIYWQINN